MRAVMDANGVITISPDTSSEAFALQVWKERAAINVDDKLRMTTHHWDPRHLHINLALEKDPQ